MNKALDRIMEGARTPEGKVIAVLLAICLALMTWNVSAIGYAVNNGDDVEEVLEAPELYEPVVDEGVEGTVVGGSSETEAPAETAAPEAAAPADTEAAGSGNEDAAGNEDASNSAAASDASANKEDKGKDDEEAKLPAQHFEGGAGGVSVSVDAPEGALPEGSRMFVSAVPASQVVDTVEGIIDGEVASVVAVDITFRDKDGNVIEPKVPIKVTFATASIAVADADDSQDVEVVHIADSGSAQVVGQDSAPASDEVAITTDEFSVYVIVTVNPETGEVEKGNEGDERLEVIFHNIDGTTTSSLVKKADAENDTLTTLVVEPEVGDLSDLSEDAIFLGWTTTENYTLDDSGSAMNMTQVYERITSMLEEGVAEGETLDLYPMVFVPFYVTYLDELGAIIQTDTSLHALNDASASYTVNALYTAKEQDENFEGWNVEEGAGNISAGDVTYVNGDTVTLTGNVTFTPYVPRGSWLVYNENGRGASYTSPEFIKTNQKTTRPSDPTRFGYTFGGWYTDVDCADDTAFTFGGTLEGKTTLYAKWVPVSDANYTVLIWKQNVAGVDENGEKIYDFAEAITLSGKVGQDVSSVVASGEGNDAYASVNGTKKQYTGFHLSEYDQNVEVLAEGTSIVNVYYDRNVVTLYFYTYTTKAAGDYVIATGNLSSGTYYILNDDGTYTEQYLYYSGGYWYRTAETTQAYSPYTGTKSGNYYVSDGNGGYSSVYLYYNGGKFYQTKASEYTYTKSNSNSNGYYYLPNGDGTYTEDYLYRDGGKWYRSRSLTWHGWEYSDQYTGDRYTRSSSARTVYRDERTPYQLSEKTTYSDQYTGDVYTKLSSSSSKDWYVAYTLTGLYGQTLADNGQAWPTELDWYNTGSSTGSTSGTRTTFLDAFMLSDGSSSESFYGKEPSGTKDIVFYKQNADGNGYTEANRVSAAANASFYISDKYNGFTAYQYRVDGGQWLSVGTKSGGYYNSGNSVSYSDTLEIRFNRSDFSINFMDGMYVSGNGSAVEGYESRGQLHAVGGITYGADISSYGKGGADYYEPEYAGFVFEGWYSDEACTHPYSFTTLPEGGVTVYAKWRQVQYRVFMHPNVPVEDESLEWGENQSMSFRINEGGTISPINGIRDGQELVGWYYDQSFTQPFAFDAVELNSSTVTADYSKTEPTEVDAYGNPTEAGNKDVDRFWISKKLDLYAKWRSTLVGAKGISVEYADENGNVLSTDDGLYADQATAYAKEAPNLGEGSTFINWAVQTWDENAGAFVDTDLVVYPGGTFTVKKDNSRVIENPNTTGDDDKYIYEFRLRAVSAASESSDTFIAYDANGGSFVNDVTSRTEFTTNTTQTLLGADCASRTGYVLVGWSLSRGDGNSVDFALGEKVSADNLDRSAETTSNTAANTLYAVWVPAVTITSASHTYTYTGLAQGPEASYEVTSDVPGFEPVTIGAGANTVSVGGMSFVITITPNEKATVTNVGDTVQNAFEYSVTYGGADASDSINVTPHYGSLSVEPMAVVVTASDLSKTYGEADPSFTAVADPAVEGLTYTVARADGATGEDVGAYALAVSGAAVQGNYAVTYVPGTLTINPKAVTVTASNATKVYGEDDPAFTAVANPAVEGLAYTVTRAGNATGEDVGTYELVATGEATQGNYTVTYEPGELSITKAPLTITVNAQDYIYSGSAQGEDAAAYTGDAAAAKVSVGEGQLKFNDIIAGITLDGAETDAGEYAGKIVASDAIVGDGADGTSTGNYNIEYVAGTLSISQSGAMELTAVGSEKVYDGSALSASYTVTVPDGSDATIMYRYADGVVDDGAEAAWSEWSTEAPARTDVGITTFEVRAENANYQTITATGELKVQPRAVTVTADAKSKTYDNDAATDPTLTYTIEGLTDADAAVEGTVMEEGAVKGSPLISVNIARAEGQDAGGYTITPTVAPLQGNYTVTYRTAQFTISPVDVTVTIVGKSASSVYDGTAHTVSGYVVNSTNVLYTEADFTFSGTAEATRLDAGTAAMGLTDAQFANNNGNFNATFAVTDGYQTITPVTTEVVVTVTGANSTLGYDANEHSVEGYTATANNELFDISNIRLVDGATAAAARTDAGTTYMGLSAESFENTSANFENVTFAVTDGYQAITPAAVTVTIVGANSTAAYDGEPHSVESYTATASDELFNISNIRLADGASAAASRTDAGTTNMGLTAASFESTDANFTVTFDVTDGYVTVNAIDVVVTIVGNNRTTDTYDGTEYSVSGYTATASTSLYDVNSDFTFTGTATAARTNAGTTDMGLAAGQFANTNPNFRTVTFNVTDGYITVNPTSAVVTIVGANKTENYSGAEHSVSGYTATTDSALYNVETDFTFSGTAEASRTDAGTTNMGLAASQFVNTNPNFKDVTFEVTDGYVTVNPIDVTVTIVGNNNAATFDGEEHSVSGYAVTSISSPLYTEDDFTFSGTAAAARTDAGTTDMGLAAEQFANTNENFANVTFDVTDGYQTITPVDEVVVTITGHNNTTAYDGAEHSVNGYDVEISNELYTEADFTFSGTASAARTDAGTANMGLAADQFANTNTNFETVTFVVTDGYQTVNPIDVTVTITGHNNTADYDGAEHSVNGYDVEISNELYTEADFTFTGTAEAVRTDAGTANMGLAAEQFANTNGNFATVAFNVTDGYQTISPIDTTVTIEGNVYNGNYDGQAHSVSGYTATADSALYDVNNDFTFSGSAIAARTDAGSTVMALKADQFANTNPNFDNVTFAITDGYVNLSQIDATVTIVGANDTADYNGQPHTVNGYTATASTSLYDVDKDFSFNGTAVATQVNAGTASMGLTASQFVNMNRNFATVTFEIADGYQTVSQIPVTVTIVGTNNTTTFDGEEHSVSGYTATASTPLYDVDKDFTFSSVASAARTDAGTSNMGLAAAQFSNTNGNFSTVTFNVTDGYQTIEKRAVTVSVTGANNATDYDGNGHTVTGYTATADYDLYDKSNSVSLVEGNTAVATRTDAGTANMGLTPAMFQNSDTNYDATFVIAADGYQTVNQINATVTIVGANNTTTFDGQAHGVNGYTAAASTPLYNVNSDFTFAGTASATRTDAGTTYMGLAASQFANTNPNFATVTFEVTDGYQTIAAVDEVVVTITGHNNATDYDGASHEVSGYDVAISNPLYTESDFSFNGSASAAQTNAGTANMGLAAEQFTNNNGNFATVTFNVTDGYQTVNPINATVNITGHNGRATYDGASHEVSGYDVEISNALYTEADFTFNGTASATRTDAGTTNMGLAASQFANTNPNFANVTFNVTDGAQVIDKANAVVNIIGHSDTADYDGTEHSVSGYDVSIEGTLYTEADFTFSGSASAARTDAGVKNMGLAADQFANTNTNFETVTFNVTDGSQTINPIDATVTIVGNNNAASYDGAEHSVSGYTATADTELFDVTKDITFSGTATAARTNAGTTNMGLASNQFANANGNFDKVTFVVTDGYQVIDPINATVTIVGAANTTMYDGVEHSVSGYTATADTTLYDVNKDFTFSGTATAAQTIFGTTNMGLAADQFANINNNFATVTFNVTDGYQAITVIPSTTVTITGANATVDYDGTEHSARGYTAASSNALYNVNSDFTFTGTATAARTGVGTTNMGLVADQFANTNKNFGVVDFVVTDGYVTVNPIDATVTIVGANATADYDGKVHTISGYTAEASNALYHVSEDFTFNGTASATRTDAGTTNMGLAASQFANTNANFRTVTFDVTDGYQTVNPIDATVTIVGDANIADYDGAEHSVGGYTTSFSTPLYTSADFTFSGAAAAKRQDAGTTNMGLAASQFANTNPNFATVTFDVTDGYQTIEPIDATVTIVGHNSTNVYDGTAYTAKGYDATFSTLLYDASMFTFTPAEGATLVGSEIAATRTIEGTTYMNLAADQFANASANFANVTFNVTDGYQAITANDTAVVTIEGNTATKTYNGLEQEVTGYRVTGITVNGKDAGELYTEDDFTFSGAARAAGTNATNGEPYAMGLSADQFTNNNTNFENVTFNVTDGSLVIERAPLTVTTDSASKPYDGTALTNASATIAGLQNNETATVSATGTITAFGKASNTRGDIEWGTASASNYTVTDTLGTLEITTNPVDITLTAASDSKTYDGTALSNAGVAVEGLPVGGGLRVEASAAGSATHVGDVGANEVSSYAVYDADGNNVTANFTGIATKNGKLTINPAQLTVVTATAEKAYDGTALVNATATIEGLQNGEVASTTATGAITDPGSTPNTYGAIIWATATESDYTVNGQLGTLSITTNSSEVTLTAPSGSKVYDGTELTAAQAGAVTASGLPAAADFRVVATASGSATNVTPGAAEQPTTTVDEGYVIMLGDQNVTEYFTNINTATGTLSITPATLAVTAEGYSGMYDGAAHGAASITNTALNNDAVANAVTYTYSWTDEDGVEQTSIDAPSVTNFGSTTYTVTASSPNYADATDEFTLTVTKRPVTLTSGSAEREYDGTALANDTVTVGGSGFVTGEGATYDVIGSQTLVGSSLNAFTYTLNEGTLAENYDITPIEGTLNVMNREAPYEITLVSNSGEYTYDGDAHEATGFTALEFTVDGNTYTVDADSVAATSGAQTNVLYAAAADEGAEEGSLAVAAYPVSITGAPVVRDASGNDVSAQFAVRMQPGALTISPRDVQLTSADINKVYDATALTNGDAALAIASGWVDGEGATYEFTGSQTLVGTSDNAFTYTLDEGTLAGNYNVATTFGTLAVTDGTGEGDSTTVPDSLVVTKTDGAANDERAYALGDTITWVVSVTNIYGEEKTLTLNEDPRVTFSSDIPTSIAPGETVTIEATHVVDEADLLAGGFDNNVTATLGELVKHASDTAELTDVAPHLTVTKAATETPEGGFALGDTIDYTISVVNDGNVTVNNVRVIDPLTGDEWAIDSLAPNSEPVEFTTSHVVTTSDIMVGTVANMATAVADGPDSGDYEVEIEPGTVTSETEGINNSMTVSKSVVEGQDVYAIGDTIRYEIVVTNDGNTDLRNIVVEDQMSDAASAAVLGAGAGVTVNSDGTAIIASLPAGESVTIPALYKVVEGDAGVQLSNVATATAPGSDNPSDRTSDEPGANPDIPATDATNGEQTMYSLTVHYYYEGTTTQAADDFVGYYAAGADVVDADGRPGIASPVINGFTASSSRVYVRVAAGGDLGMPAANSEFDVYYAPTPVPAQVVVGGDNGLVAPLVASLAPAAAAAAPGAPVALTIDDDGNPLVESIDDDGVALSGGEASTARDGSWALFNLLATILAVVLTAIMLVGAFSRRREDDDSDGGSGGSDSSPKRHRTLRIASIVPAAIAIVLLLAVQDFSKPMVMFDAWSVLFAIIAIVNIVLLVASRKQAGDDGDDESQQTGFAPASA